MPRVGLLFRNGPAKQDRPVQYELEELPGTWNIVFRSENSSHKKTAVYELVEDRGAIGEYEHVETVDEVRRNH